MKMPHAFLTVALLAGLTAALAAQQPPPENKNQKEADYSSKDILARVAKDFQAAEERLKKIDPGDVTRKIQRDIVDGLDELIKQDSKSQAGAGDGASNKMQGGGSQKQNGGPKGGLAQNSGGRQDAQSGPNNAEKAADQDQPGRAKGGKDQGQQGKNKDRGKSQGDGKDDKDGAGKEGAKKEGGNSKDDKDGAGKEGAKKDDGKDDQKGQAKGGEAGQGQEGGLGSVKNAKSSKAKTNLTAETYRTDWGHLPFTKRLEMDAYSKERFMPRYDEMLQQYYRAVAEQGRGKND